jgi:osmoprotectant transport system substrate-binding protein
MLKRPFHSTLSRALLFLTIGLTLYGWAKWLVLQAPNQADIIVGSKNFTESRILGEMYALALEQGGFQVRRRFNLGGTLIAHAALQKGEIDVYPEYTGTGFMNVLGLPPERNEAQLFQILNREYHQKWRLRWLDPSQANDSQGLVVSRLTAEKYQLYTLTRLAELSGQLRLASIPEFEDREDGLKGLGQAYPHLHFKQTQQYDNGLKYRVLRGGNADVTVGFTTDGELTDPQLTLLRDDRHFWPGYHISPVVREATLNQHPAIAGILNRISGQLDTETMRQLNAAVDLKKQDYQTVARQFLKKRSLAK